MRELRKKGHVVVLHLPTAERKPIAAVRKVFDAICTTPTDFDTVADNIKAFSDEHPSFGIAFKRTSNSCTLSVPTLDGAQQGSEMVHEARSTVAGILKENDKFHLEEISADRMVHLRVWIDWPAIAKAWAGREIKDIADRTIVVIGCGNLPPRTIRLCAEDKKAKSIARLVDELQAGKPFLAKRSKHTVKAK
jgi:hypothetical protein